MQFGLKQKKQYPPLCESLRKCPTIEVLCHNIPPCSLSPLRDLISVIWLRCWWRPCRAVRGARVELRVKTQLRFFIGGHSSPALTPPPGRTREFKSHGGARFQTFNWREIFIFYLHRGGRTDRVKCGIDFQHDPIYNLDFMMKRFTKAIRKDLLTRV